MSEALGVCRVRSEGRSPLAGHSHVGELVGQEAVSWGDARGGQVNSRVSPLGQVAGILLGLLLVHQSRDPT